MQRLKKVLITVVALASLALGGAGLAGATGGDTAAEERGDDGKALTGTTLERASQAALAATGGGTVGETETDGENGATYEVEVNKTDGSQVDVRLDDRFDIVVIEGDREQSGEHDG